MFGFINKMKRNYASSDCESEFEKRLIKATYPDDDKEPKFKHVEYIINSMKGNAVHYNPKEAFNILYQKYMSNISSWVHTLKCFIIFHTGLQDMQTSTFVSKEISARSSNMPTFLKPFEDKTYEVAKHNDIIKIYLEYIKSMAEFIEEYGIIHLSNKDLLKYIENMPIENAFTFYSKVENLLNLGIQASPYFVFCCRFRIYKQMITQLFLDINKLYRICSELIKFFKMNMNKLNINLAKNLSNIYTSFNKMSNKVKLAIESATSLMKTGITVPTLLTIVPEMIQELNQYIAMNNDQEQNENQEDNEEYQIEGNVEEWMQEKQNPGKNTKANYQESDKENFYNGNLTNQPQFENCKEFDDLFGILGENNANCQKQNNSLKTGVQNNGGSKCSGKNVNYPTQSKPQNLNTNAKPNLMDMFS